MGFNDLSEEFGLTVEISNNADNEAMIFRFRSKDGRYGHYSYTHIVERWELLKFGSVELERIITEKVRGLFKNIEESKNA